GEPEGGGAEERARRSGIGLDEQVQALAIEHEERDIRLGLNRRRPRRSVEQTHLAEEISRLRPRQDLFDPSADDLRDDGRALAHDEHLLAGIALAEEHLTGLEAPLTEPAGERQQLTVGEFAEELHAL